MTQEIVLVTGAGSGIGRGLAEAFAARCARVIAAGRTREPLDALAARRPGIEVEILDVADPAAVRACAARVAERHPGLTTLVNNAGIQRIIDFNAAPHPDEILAEEIDINLRGLIEVTNAFLPLLGRQKAARLVQVGSGLGYVPLAAAPIYSATKAAVHAFTIALRHQLRASSVRVIEIIPPVVDTGLHRGQSRKPHRAMPLDAFVREAMAGLDAGRDEIPVGLAKVLRTGSRAAPGLFFRIINKPR